MKCEDFKNRMSVLWDKPNHTQEAEELMRHIEECETCKAEYEGLSRTISMLTPHHAPEMKAEKTATVPKHTISAWGKKMMRTAAAIAIFAVGVATGLSNFFSVDAQASKSSELLRQALLSMRSAGNFIMELKVRTQPQESFAYFSPYDSMMNVNILSMQTNGRMIWRIEKEEGRTVVCDGERKYMWMKHMKVTSDINGQLEENFSVLLNPSLQEAKNLSFFGMEGHNDIHMSETDSTTIVTVVSDRPGNGLINLYNNDTSGKRNKCTTESTFSKRDGLLRKIRIWIETDGVKTLILESQSIAYNVAMDAGRILQLPESDGKEWIAVDQVNKKSMGRRAKKENATKAAERIVQALIKNQPEEAKNELFYYSQTLDVLTEHLKGCQATGFSQPKQVDDYPGVYVFYELILPDGETQKRHVALKFNEELRTWMLDGGL
ncbi:MAG: hypothetical protein NC206_03000 [Bacteroides sp.]|nr:hypothetical protein [Roseburia sp.]MCM1346032.1 hypothetical protein [Bacteroides sp.]MCM1420193.1 hypothetical protein [Bacteroides sp.]